MKRAISILAMLGALSAWAQVYDGPGDMQGPPAGAGPMGPGDPNAGAYDPSHGVARISLIEGNVGVGRGDTGETVAAAMNAPLMAHDRLLTGSQSRAEIQLDHGDILRVDQQSEVRFNDLEFGRYQAQLAIGTVTLTVFGGSQIQGEIDTPSVSVRPMGPGAYRVTVNPDGTSLITTRAGQAEIYTPSGTEPLQTGQTMQARGPASDPEFQMVQAIPMDEWDQWNLSHDQQFERASQQAYQYVNPQIDGAEDLSGQGQWEYEAPYGEVWEPNVAPGWAPYQNGRWDYENYYGWTWISYDPWGWAPYHYGRWFWGRRGWAWYPGAGAQFWNPALVAFFGFGRGVGLGLGFGFGNIGWVALAPFELFHPWWGHGFGGGIVGNFNVYNTYRNARVAGGVMGVAAGEFGRRGFSGTSMRVGAADLTHAGLVRGAMPISPSRESYRMSDRAVNAGAFPRTENTRFASFGRAGGSAVGAGSAASHGWDRFGQPIHTGGSTARGFGGASTGGWQRFNAPAQSSFGATRGYQGGYSAPRSFSGAGSQPLRISPPVVGNRPAGGYGYGGGSGYAPRSFGSPTYSAPRSYSAPSYGGRSYSAPSRSYGNYGGGSRQSYSAPKSNGGGGGSSHAVRESHSGGGGGGGHESHGGGGGHSGGGGGGHRR